MTTTPPAPQPEPEQSPYKAGSVVVPRRPDEVGFPLRRDEFDILCDGGIHHERAGRDLWIGCCVTPALSLVGAGATTGWSLAWQPGHHDVFIFIAILILATGGSAMGIIIHHCRIKKTKGSSPYSRLKKRIEDFFENQGVA